MFVVNYGTTITVQGARFATFCGTLPSSKPTRTAANGVAPNGEPSGITLAALAGNRELYRDGIHIAFLEGNSTRFLEPVEPEIENLARLALHGHAEPTPHLPRLRRLARLEAARALTDRRARPAGRWLRGSGSKTA
jgi:hypothetical protein